MPRKKTHEEFEAELAKIFPNLELVSEYLSDKKDIYVRCKTHDYTFKTKPVRLRKGHGCQKCYDERRGNSTRKSLEGVIATAKEKHDDKFDYSLIKEYKKEQIIDAVIAGFSTELTYKELQDGCLYLQTQDCLFIATNGDWRCPIEDGLYIPDCGGMCEWIYHCTGKRATVMGKPNPEIITYLAEQFHVSLDEVLAVGDRLYTDIQVAVNAKVDSVAVLSGESSLEDINNYPEKPTFILKSIKELPELLEK